MKVVPFPSKMVYIDEQGVRLQGGASPYKNVVKYPFPTPRPWPHCSKQDEDKPGLQ